MECGEYMSFAIFVGGAFDMTKREMYGFPTSVTFFEPMDPGFVADFKTEDKSVPCRVLEYRLVFETRQGVRIYEFQKIKP